MLGYQVTDSFLPSAEDHSFVHSFPELGILSLRFLEDTKKAVHTDAFYATSRSMSRVLFLLILQGCGYSFQHGGPSPLKEQGVERLYIQRVQNQSMVPGLEMQLLNEMQRVILIHKKITLVQSIEQADAVLMTNIETAEYGSIAGTNVESLTPTTPAYNMTGAYVISTQYQAQFVCNFALHHRKSGKILWSNQLVQLAPFPGANQREVPGTTSLLINQSEFGRTLTDLMRTMVNDMHESMLALF